MFAKSAQHMLFSLRTFNGLCMCQNQAKMTLQCLPSIFRSCALDLQTCYVPHFTAQKSGNRTVHTDILQGSLPVHMCWKSRTAQESPGPLAHDDDTHAICCLPNLETGWKHSVQDIAHLWELLSSFHEQHDLVLLYKRL